LNLFLIAAEFVTVFAKLIISLCFRCLALTSLQNTPLRGDANAKLQHGHLSDSKWPKHVAVQFLRNIFSGVLNFLPSISFVKNGCSNFDSGFVMCMLNCFNAVSLRGGLLSRRR